MKKIAGYIVVLISSVLLLSCGGGSDESLESVSCQQAIAQNGCGIPVQNKCVHDIMKEYYLWYQQVEPVIDYYAFNSPEETLDYLRYQSPGLDRFSYITQQSTYDSLFNEGQYLGYGFSFETDASGRVWVRFVYTDSPAYRSGMRRGDEIISINLQTLTEITSNPDWDDILGPAQEGYAIDMVLSKADHSTSSIHMQKTTVSINTILHSSIIENGAIKTGYLVFNSFLETSNAEFEQVFAEFKAKGVNRVILDLRYNGGGRVSVANNLASYLNQVSTSSNLFNRLVFNDKNQSQNTNYFLQQFADGLTLDKLIVITTGQTCSASEMIINGLNTYLPVKTVGSTTCGKPVGMNGFDFCGKTMLPITFKAENRNGEGGYFDGIQADCTASDDIHSSFGDTSDPMLSEAIYLAKNGSCSTSKRAARTQSASTSRASGTLREIIGAY
jgi:carboxyl-terminal processing protease